MIKLGQSGALNGVQGFTSEKKNKSSEQLGTKLYDLKPLEPSEHCPDLV